MTNTVLVPVSIIYFRLFNIYRRDANHESGQFETITDCCYLYTNSRVSDTYECNWVSQFQIHNPPAARL